MSDLEQFMSRVEGPRGHTLDEFTSSPLTAWEATVEGQLAEGAGFSDEICGRLRELNEFSRSATKKQVRNFSKKLAKKMTSDRTTPKFSTIQRDVTLKFD
jgi:hypothetical protein